MEYFKEKIPLIRVDPHYSQIPYLHTFYLLKFMFLMLSQSFTEMCIHRIAKNLGHLMCNFQVKLNKVMKFCLLVLVWGLIECFFGGVILLFKMAPKHSAEILVRVPKFKELCDVLYGENNMW